jgi:hypothetical protein
LRFLEKLLRLSSLEGSNLVPKRLLLLQGAASSLYVIVLIWGVVFPARFPCSIRAVSVLYHNDVILSFLDSKVACMTEWLRARDNRCKMVLVNL